MAGLLAHVDADAVQEVRSSFVGFCKASANLNQETEHECAKFAEVLKLFLRKKADDTARRHPQHAALVSYISDGASVLCQSTATASSQDRVVMRKGKHLEEFLMQRASVHVVTPAGGREVAVVVADPKPLTKGKKATNLFVAGAKYYHMLRSLGREGLVIFHSGADRMMLSAVDRLFRRRQQAYYTVGHGPVLGDKACELEQTDLHVCTGCALHDSSNAIQWGLASVASADVLKDLHVVIESCRNSFTFIHANLASFLVKHVAFAPPPRDSHLVLRFWQALGVDTEWLDDLAFLNPWWDGHSLLISEGARDHDDLIGKISSVVLYVWKWKKFVETRWCTIGPSCRAIVASLCLGLQEVVAITMADTVATNFHLHGFVDKLSLTVRTYACVASIAAYPADALQVELLEDDRVARRPLELKEALGEEVRWVAQLDDFTWGRLAQIAGGDSATSAYDLRSAALSAVHVSCAYIHKKIFEVVDGFPWKLAEGDISRNLDRLAKDGYTGEDPATLKLLGLLRIGYNRARLADGVALLRDIPWSTKTVEQAHGSMAVIHRLHPTMSARVLTHRAMLHQCRSMFEKPADAKRIERAEGKAEKLRNRMPQRAGAKQLYLRELMREAKASLPHGTKMSVDLRQTIMRRHSELFRELEPSEQRSLEATATNNAEVTRRRTSGELEHVNAHVALQKARLAKETSALCDTNTLSGHRLSEEDLLALRRLLDSPDFKPAAVKALRDKALEAPDAPSTEQLAALQACDLQGGHGKDPSPHPEWLRHVCYRRADYSGCALFAGDLKLGDVAYLFLFAMQNPLSAMFLQLRRSVLRRDAPTLENLLDSSASAFYEFEFVCEPSLYYEASQLPFDSVDGLFVLEDLKFDSSGLVCSDSMPVPWKTEFALRLPIPASAKKKPKATGPPKAEREQLLLAHPWLRGELAAPEAKGDRQGNPAAEGSDDESEVAVDDVIAKAVQEVAEKRRKWELEGLDTLEDFRTKLLGDGQKVRANKLDFAAVVGVACGRAATDWCRHYGLGLQTSFSHVQYTQKDCSRMALEWCKRMQHFFGIYKQQEDADYVYSLDDLASYTCDEDWVSYISELDPASPAAARSAGIGQLTPNRYPASTSGAASSSSKRSRA